MRTFEAAQSNRFPRVIHGGAGASGKYLFEPSPPFAPRPEDEQQSPAPLHERAEAIGGGALWERDVIKNDHVGRRQIGI